MQLESSHKTLVYYFSLLLLLVSFTASTAKAGYLYVFNQGNGSQNKLYGFRVNESTGELTLIPGFPISTGLGTGGYPSRWMTLDPINKRLFTIENGTPVRVHAFSINPNGTVSPIIFTHPITSSFIISSIAVHPSGSPLLLGGGSSSFTTVRSFVITATDAVEVAGSPFSTGDAQPVSSVFTKDGQFFYTGGNSGPSFAGFSVNSVTGVLTPLPGSPFNSGANFPLAFATDSTNRLFSAHWQAGILRVFGTDGGIPTQIGNTYPSGLTQATDGILHPSEQFYLVADRGSHTVASYKINGLGSETTLAATGPPVSSGGLQPNALAINRDGSLVFAANGDSRNVSTYRINTNTGVLTRIAVQPAGTVGASDYLAGIGYLKTDSPGPFDFDGDGKTDIGIFRPAGSASEWWVNRSSTGQTFALQFGASTDQITPADSTGDGKADIAFFRPASGEWYVLRSEDFSFFALPFGTNGDVPVPADYDADGKADFAVFRPSNSTWFISQSGGAPTRIVQFGVNGDQPVVADYDADGKADIGIFRPAAGGAEWWIQRSTAGLLAMQFGASTDKAVQGDYTGDGKADVAVWRPSTGEWFIVRSEDSSLYGFPFGADGDVPSPGDYDGDGKFDATVFRPSSATWFIARSTAGTQIVQFGATGDQPIPSAFVR
jgi:6-phosphogluconolactonase (cycloisomerase 2 family)